MLLVIDIGNTNIVLGVFEGAQLVHSWRVSSRRDQTAHEYAVLCRNLFGLSGLSVERVKAAVICSVVPPLNDAFAHLAQEFFGVQPLFLEADQQDLMRIRYHPPADVGADRIVNAVAARELVGSPCIVVDFGTATTFDVISPEGDYCGGLIAPGIGISSEALFVRAAKLPRIEIKRPEHVVGRSTVESIQAGIFHGYIGLVSGILALLRKEAAESHVVATGGFARLIATGFSGFDHIDENLTLHGLRICFEKLVQRDRLQR